MVNFLAMTGDLVEVAVGAGRGQGDGYAWRGSAVRVGGVRAFCFSKGSLSGIYIQFFHICLVV